MEGSSDARGPTCSIAFSFPLHSPHASRNLSGESVYTTADSLARENDTDACSAVASLPVSPAVITWPATFVLSS